MRLTIVLIGAIAASLLARPAQGQTGFDRRGGDYLSFPIRSGDPAVCAARCERDSRCRAWTFAYPRTTNVLATCWLKNQVPPRNQDACCVSGVRGAGVIELRAAGVEYGIDRLGGDYRNFDVPMDPAGAPCATACTSENRCRAWTYVRPGYIGATPRCYLKDKLKAPRHKPCCISGVVR